MFSRLFDNVDIKKIIIVIVCALVLIGIIVLVIMYFRKDKESYTTEEENVLFKYVNSWISGVRGAYEGESVLAPAKESFGSSRRDYPVVVQKYKQNAGKKQSHLENRERYRERSGANLNGLTGLNFDAIRTGVKKY